MESNGNKIVSLNNNRQNGKSKKTSNKKSPDTIDNSAILIVNGQEIHLKSFVLSGESTEEHRVLLTWHSNLDELLSYTKSLEVLVHDRVKNALSDIFEM